MILTENYGELQDLDQKLAKLDNKLSKLAKEQADCGRLMSISGIGCLTAMALISHIGNVGNFHNERQLAEYFDLTPREYSSGGKQKISGIAKHGDQRIRALFRPPMRRLWAWRGAREMRVARRAILPLSINGYWR